MVALAVQLRRPLMRLENTWVGCKLARSSRLPLTVLL